ncbi:Centrin-2 [Tetrabaena socialis]|uniref:Caltractin n=1 Tax=Tetrabaena socialis TaxID=47790 RepID=A0A2J7ZW79_9CHLO|nr:Centrin-2 [Tetrabaena socialis]|eukprot:PNH04541.1 Centrin-2 [Tetrabaena socialis]
MQQVGPSPALVFGSSRPLHPHPKPAAPRTRELTKDESDGILFSFETLDPEHTGYVSHKQLKVALRALGFGVKSADVQSLLARHGEESTRLDYATFRRLVADALSQRSLLDEHRRAFQLFDVLGQGAIDFMTLKRVVRSLNMDIPDAELQDMISEFGKDGLISEQDWLAIMSSE